MADNTTSAAPSSAINGSSAQPSSYDHQNGSNGVPLPSTASQMPPLSIPQNNNPPPQDIMSPTGSSGQASRSGTDPNKKALYVGGLDPRVTEEVLRQVFETTGHVASAKIIPEKNFAAKGCNYGFVEYEDPAAAERAMQTLNGRRIHQSEIRVNWAYQSNSITKEDTTGHHHIFVGDLSNEVNDEVLLQAFSTFGTVSEARVMWDMKTGRSRGYGFVAFSDRAEAEKALTAMDGEWLGSRAIRCNWANQKGQPQFQPPPPQQLQMQIHHQPQQQPMMPMSAAGISPITPFGTQPQQHGFPTQGINSYEMVLGQTPQWQTTVYVGNLTPYTNQNDLVPLFANFGYVTETRFQSDRGFAFVKMDTHENAATAICQLNGYGVNGRPLKCSWGKDRPPAGQYDAFSPASAGPHPTMGPQAPQAYGFPPYGGGPAAMSPQGYTQPQYGMPPNMPQYPQGANFGRDQPGAYMAQTQVSPPYGTYPGY